MNFVIDASVAIKWFVEEDLHEGALTLLDRADELSAPDLLIAEVTNIAWKKARRGELEQQQALAIAISIRHRPITLLPSSDLNEHALRLAMELDHPVYDCLYLACAEMTGGVVVTADKRFRQATAQTPFADFVQDLAEVVR